MVWVKQLILFNAPQICTIFAFNLWVTFLANLLWRFVLLTKWLVPFNVFGVMWNVIGCKNFTSLVYRRAIFEMHLPIINTYLAFHKRQEAREVIINVMCHTKQQYSVVHYPACTQFQLITYKHQTSTNTETKTSFGRTVFISTNTAIHMENRWLLCCIVKHTTLYSRTHSYAYRVSTDIHTHPRSK